MVEFSHDSEREKVQHVSHALNLTSAGLTSRENVTEVGNVLGCDWLVSGTIVSVEAKIYLWTKIISVQDGVLRDLNLTPYSSASAKEIAANLAKFVTRSSVQSAPSEFIALGAFEI